MSLPASWQPLSESEDRQLHRHFMHEMGFAKHRNAEGSSTIIEPENSKTYALRSRGPVGSETYEATSLALCRDYIRLFRATVSEDDFVFAYDPYHQSYKFWPHQLFRFDSEFEWPISPYPDGDYCAFFASNLKSGLFGYPWVQATVCVFGNRFLDGMQACRPNGFAQVIRIGGKSER
jgi:hypothetical protein